MCVLAVGVEFVVQKFEPIPPDLDRLAGTVVDSALRVHRGLGPGVLEQVYERCLAYELTKRGIPWKRQVTVPIRYDGVDLNSDLRLDLLVGGAVVVEVKSVEVILPVHKAKILTYLKLTEFRLGFLINFNVPLIKHGISRIAR